MPVYALENVTKVYAKGNVLANDGITLDIEQGEVFGLLGPNGAGKTTLIKQLVGLLAPTSGSIRLFGGEIAGNAAAVPHLVSYMTQRPGALADLTVTEALEVTGRFRDMSRTDAARQATGIVEEFGLEDCAGRVLGKLSGGQQRLVAFGMSLMADRPVLILDEPTNDIDPLHRRQLWDKVRSVSRERGCTVILVTHNVVEAEQVLQRVGIINRGKVIALGTVGELKAKVDRRIRLELRFKPQVDEAVQRDLTGLIQGEVRALSPGHWLALVDEGATGAEVARMLAGPGLKDLDDFRILKPTLEDVYIQLGGGGGLAATGAA